MRQLEVSFPPMGIGSTGDIEDERVRQTILDIVDLIDRLHKYHIEVVNFNSVDEVTQASQPTPEEGRMYVWNDSNAASGQPTHYLVYNMGGTVVTFASQEVAP